jgi:hypothetical protein
MYCPVWHELYEEYEKAERQRVTRQKKQPVFAKHSDAELLNRTVTRKLQELREHEQEHQCRG